MEGKTNGIRNRNAGHGWEREIVDDILHIFPNAQTSRSCNRTRDAQGVDIAHADELEHGRFPYNFQAKNNTQSITYPKVLSMLQKGAAHPNTPPVILHKQTEKAGASGRFMERGRYAIMFYEDFLKHLEYRKGFEILTEYIDFIPREERLELEKRLIALHL